jgi:hypothetical protein
MRRGGGRHQLVNLLDEDPDLPGWMMQGAPWRASLRGSSRLRRLERGTRELMATISAR